MVFFREIKEFKELLSVKSYGHHRRPQSLLYLSQGGYSLGSNATKPGVYYDHRLEVVRKIRGDDLKLGKLSE